MLETLVEALKQLNNREMAIGIWLVVALIAALLAKSVRTGLADVLKCLLMPKLLLLFGSLAAYVALLAWLLSQVQLWTFDQLTATVLWYFLSGVGLLNGVFSIKEGDRHFAKLARSAFTLTVVVEFVAVAYTFGLLAELVLVPVLVFLGLLSGVAGTKPKYGPTKRLLEWVLAAFGILLTWVSIRQIVVDPTAFFTTATGRSFVLPIALTLGSFPLLYLWYAVTKLESAFISIGLKNYPPIRSKSMPVASSPERS